MKKQPTHQINKTQGRFGVPDSIEVCELIANSIPLEVLEKATRILDVGIGCGGISRAIVKRLEKELYIDHFDAIMRVYGIDSNLALVKGVRRNGFINTHCEDFLNWQTDMKFDLVVGNPPYGKCSSLAVKFLNKSFELAPLVFYVLPRTFNSPSILNRVHPNLHLIENTEADNDTFGGTILTCIQKWERREETREKIKVMTKHPDFCFVSKEESNLFIGRIGAAGGSVKDSGYNHYTYHHYFLQATDLMKERLMMIEDTLKVLAKTGNVGTPSLSKHELISTYVERFG